MEDHATAQALAGLFARDSADCVAIQLRDWRARAWHLRLREYFWGQVETWLNRRSYRRRIHSISRRNAA